MTDTWLRRPSPPKQYRRHFFRARVDDPRDEWIHVVTGDGEEEGLEFEFFWTDLPPSDDFALALDDYLELVEPSTSATVPFR